MVVFIGDEMAKKKNLIYTFYALLPLLCLFAVLAISWFLAAIIELYTNNLSMLNTLNRFTEVRKVGIKAPIPPYPGNNLDNIFWFVQLTDIHISKFRSHGQVEDFGRFCSTMLPYIKPSLVLVTGDLTDAKDETLIGSGQYEQEWKVYSSMVHKCITPNTQWIDIRGNHDSFAVTSLSNSANMFEEYGLSKRQYDAGIYQYIHNATYGKYAFNGIDIAPNPGPGRPFNFFGIPNQRTLENIKTVSSINKFNGTIWFGHYPLSVTNNPHLLRNLLSISGVAYLCGHLHTILGIFPQIHAVHSEGLLELELGDWKENRRFRIGVFDHDVFSFADATMSPRPVVIFTNPTDAHYIIPEKMPFMRSRKSSHIRFLVFHSKEISRVEVLIDGSVICSNTDVLENILHVCKWTPSLYLMGMHQLTAAIKDKYGVITVTSIEFSLDGTRPPLSFLSVILLLTDFCTMLRMLFMTSVLIAIVFPVILRNCHKNYYVGSFRQLIEAILPQLVYFIDCNKVFWPLLYYNLYLCVGPFSIGYFVPSEIGFAFAYGIYSGYHFIYESTTYLYVAIQLLLINSILMVGIGETIKNKGKRHASIFRRIFFESLFIFLILTQFISMRTYLIAYGKLACCLNALTTWTIPFSIYLRYLGYNVNTVSLLESSY